MIRQRMPFNNRGRRKPQQGRPTANKLPMGPNKRNRFTKEKDTRIEVCSWDVEGAGSPEEIDQHLTASLSVLPEVVCLQRANLPPENTETKNYKWVCSSAATTGSAILLNKSSKLVLSTLKQPIDHICIAEMEGKFGAKVHIISVYIPPATDYLCKELWATLEDVITSIPPMALFIAGGNFNAQIGKTTSTPMLNSFKKGFYHTTTNENGKTFSELIRKCHLKLLVTQKRGTKEYFTFKDGESKTQESFFLIPFLRHAFSGEGFHVWRGQFNHAILRQSLIFSPNQPFHVENDNEEATNVKPPVIGTWNIQNATPVKVDAAMSDFGIPIVCVQELFLTSEEDIQTDNYTWHSSKKLWAKNVGVLVKKSPNITLQSFEPLSENLCAATIQFFGQPLIVISMFLPLPDNPQHGQVMNQVKALVKGIPRDIMVVVGSDFGSVINNKEEVHNADEFVTELGKETNLKVAEGFYSNKSVVTHLTETTKVRCHYLLVSASLVETKYIRFYYRWIPHFDNTVACVVFSEKEEKPAKKEEVITFASLDSLDSIEEESQPMEEDGDVKKQIILFKPKGYKGDLREDIHTLVSADDVEKFKDSPASAEDLGRMLKDLVLFFLPQRKSQVVNSPSIMVIRAFSDSKFGLLSLEDIVDSSGDGRRLCRLRWQGILLSEEVGKKDDSPVVLKYKVFNSLIAKLSQTCYTIRPKKSFFNKGKCPLLMDTPELKDLLRKVSKQDFPQMDELFKHIDEFIDEDSDAELIFGIDFPKADQLQIIEYISSKSELIDFRLFTSKGVRQERFNVAVFRKRSSQYWRDLLIKKPTNYKYYLIHPCGLGGHYEEFNKKFSADVIAEEAKLFNKANADLQKQTKNHQPTKIPEKNIGSSSVKRTVPQPITAPRQVATPRQGQQSRNARQSQLKQPNPQLAAGKRPQPLAGRKRDYNSSFNGATRPGLSSTSYNSSIVGEGKRQKMDSFRVEVPRWSDIRPLVMIWPITVRSQLEDRPEQVIKENFTVEFKTKDMNNQSVTAVFVALTHFDGYGRMYCIARGSTIRNASRIALDLLTKHCTVIKPSPSYLCNGGIPNFIRYKVPCQLTPRTYILLDKFETGSLSWKTIEDLMDRFLRSCEEEVYFDRDSYSFEEKLAIVENVPKMTNGKLLVRHFGDDMKLVDRYVCVYKMKPKQDILREVLKMRHQHPKYIMTTNRLPPDIEYNIF